jgi:hypothetical protein
VKQWHDSQYPVRSWRLQLPELMTLRNDIMVREHDLNTAICYQLPIHSAWNARTYRLGQPRRPARKVQISTDFFVTLSAWNPVRRIWLVSARGITVSRTRNEVLYAEKALSMAFEQEDMLARDIGIVSCGQRHVERGGQSDEEFRLGDTKRVGHFLDVVSGRSAVDAAT